MKQKFKKIYQLLIFCTVIVVSSCQKDYEMTKSNEQRSVFGKVNLNEIPEIKKAIDKKRNNSTARQNASIYLSLINPENIITVIDSLGHKSYTFSLNLEEENELTNLVIQETASGLQYYLVKYTATNFPQWKSDLNNKTVSSIRPNAIYELLDAPTTTTARTDCFDASVNYVCPSGQHGWGQQALCEFYFDEWSYITTYSNADCGGDSGSSTSPNIGGGGNAAALPCKKIKNQSIKYPSLKPALVALAGTTSQNHENGIFVDNTATATTTTPVQNIPNVATVGGTIPLNMNPPNKYTVIAHTHDASGSQTPPVGTYSIFSWDDLTTINQLIKDNHIDTSAFVFYVITADGTRYAMTIEDPSALSDFFYNPRGLPVGTPVDPQKFTNLKKMHEQYYNKKTNGLIQPNSDPIKDQKSFLQFMNDANLGISLFIVDSTFSTYNKLSLASNGTVIQASPCF